MNGQIKDGSYGIKLVEDGKTSILKIGIFVLEFGKLHFAKNHELVIPLMLDNYDLHNASEITLTIDRSKAQQLKNHLELYISQYDKAQENQKDV